MRKTSVSFVFRRRKKNGVLKNSYCVIRIAQISILLLIFADFMCKTDNYYGKTEENCKIVFSTRLFCVLLCTDSVRKGSGLTLSTLTTN